MGLWGRKCGLLGEEVVETKMWVPYHTTHQDTAICDMSSDQYVQLKFMSLSWLSLQESEKDKLRSSLGNAIMVERPNVKV